MAHALPGLSRQWTTYGCTDSLLVDLMLSSGSEERSHSCTQCVTKSAKCAAGCLGVPEALVRVVVKRIGGGFGGKETLSIFRSGALALAAAKTKRACRLTLDRAEDMLTSGQSHPFLCRYKVGFDGAGRVLGCDVSLYNNGGCTICCSNVVMDRGVAHFHNAYRLGALRVVGRIAWTHLPSNTAFRGFGVPQAALCCDAMLEAIARELGAPVSAVQRANLIDDTTGAETTPYGQRIPTACLLPRMWDQLHDQARLAARRAEVDSFNATSRWRKRGLALVPTMYGINFPLKYLNQAGAHVLVYTDGSVLVTHAGTEMGQGLHTKCIQIAAQALGVPPADVHVAETACDRVHNTSPTAASVGSDLNGMAVLDA